YRARRLEITRLDRRAPPWKAIREDSGWRGWDSLLSRNRWLRARAYRQIAFPQFFDIGQFLQIAQTEVIEKKLRGLVQQRPSRNFRSTANFDEPAFHQCLQNPIDGDAADGLDIRAGDRLAIGDDGERFECGRGQARRFRHWEKLAHPIGIRGIGRELP